mmetsp:Transcript_65227/g.194481  ORF Transcript_65227/g.194481 Transcript_65227/m.194481 type:complete len:205 (+) Transcript_65227:569-1183(+)
MPRRSLPISMDLVWISSAASYRWMPRHICTKPMSPSKPHFVTTSFREFSTTSPNALWNSVTLMGSPCVWRAINSSSFLCTSSREYDAIRSSCMAAASERVMKKRPEVFPCTAKRLRPLRSSRSSSRSNSVRPSSVNKKWPTSTSLASAPAALATSRATCNMLEVSSTAMLRQTPVRVSVIATFTLLGGPRERPTLKICSGPEKT